MDKRSCLSCFAITRTGGLLFCTGKSFGILAVLLVFISNAADEDNGTNLIQFGIRGSFSIGSVESVNDLASKWSDEKSDMMSSDLIEMEYQGLDLPINFEFGFEPFIRVLPFRFLAVHAGFGYGHSPHLYNSVFKDTIEININTYMPSAGIQFILGRFLLGISYIHGITQVEWQDEFFVYDATWYATTPGFIGNCGLIIPIGKFFGFEMNAKYRYLKHNEIKDNSGRMIRYSETGENLEINLSQFVLDMGLYFGIGWRSK
jgi:hypothetical protein